MYSSGIVIILRSKTFILKNILFNYLKVTFFATSVLKIRVAFVNFMFTTTHSRKVINSHSSYLHQQVDIRNNRINLIMSQ
jgi:hypothetical protein